MSIRRACLALQLSFSVYYYKFKPKETDQIIIDELEVLAEGYPTYGFRKMFHLLRSKGSVALTKSQSEIY